MEIFVNNKINKQTARLIYAWLFFAVSTLIFAGIFAFLLAMSRTPFIQGILPVKDYLHTALVTHVVLSVVIWFLAFEGVLWILTGTIFSKGDLFSIPLSWVGFFLSAGGTIIIIVSGIRAWGEPLLANYIPVLTHPAFYTGLIMFASGIFLTIANTLLSVYNINTYFEKLFWGGGHILQFSNTFGMICAWILLSQIILNKSPMSDRPAKLFLLISFGFTLPAPLFYFSFNVIGMELRDWFTRLMQLGMGPPAGAFAIAVIIAIKSFKNEIKKLPWDKPGFSALIFSIILFSTGGILSLMIRGIDVKIPSHYHGVIGGVTLSFMGLSYYILPLLNRDVPDTRMAKIQPYLYGIGQMLFILGMFWAGTHGVPRKTYGEAQKLDDFVKLAGMGIMGFGGLIAILGGATFVLNILIPLLKKTKTNFNH